MGEHRVDFPLFPLGLAAVPHELVPLHIFEDRFKTMIGEVPRGAREFGIVWAAEDGLKANGCAMEVAEVVERHDDGRLDILARGTRPFRVVEEHFDHIYPAGEVEFLDDQDEAPDAGTVDAAHEAYGDLVRGGHRQGPGARGARAADRLRDGGDRRLRASTPSRGCSTCAPRTRGCGC